MRAHVVLPEELIREIDEVAGKRQRSRFIEEAIKDKLQHVRQGRALREGLGVIDPALHPEWATPEMVSEWVRNLRREADEQMQAKMAGREDVWRLPS